MKRYFLLNIKKEVLFSEINRPPYRGSKYPSFSEVSSLAYHYREHGEKVFIKSN